VAFDTLDYARKLEAAGVPAAQAEVHSRALNEALAGSVASKSDIANLELRIDARFAQVDARFEQVDARFEQVDARFVDLESRLSTRIDSVKTELKLDLGGRIQTLRWMLGVLVAMNATIIARLFLER
jgi:hypothetical protein